VIAVDRSRLPVPGPSGPFAFPRIERLRLDNGLDVRAVSHRSVPVVSMVLVVPGGSSSDPADRPGLASLTADLLDEGSRGFSALQVSDRLARIGADLDVEVGPDATIVALTTLLRFADQGLELAHEIASAPNLTDADFSRVRQLRIERLRQMRDHPSALADRAFAQVVYQTHPYALPGYGTAASLARLTPDDVRACHRRMYRPEGTTLVIVGDRAAGELAAGAAAVFGDWSGDRSLGPGGADGWRTAPTRTPAARLAAVARPGAAQSELRVGHVAASRSTPDYPALVLLNTILGGQFVSRLNMNLREDKGYTYGVRTGFDLRRGEGPFVLQTSVGTDVTAPALREAFSEMHGIRGERPVTADELALARSSVALGYPRGFETAQQVARAVAQLALYDLPDSYFEQFVPSLDAVTLDDITAVARRYLDPDRMATIVVGDLEKIGDSLGELGLGELVTVEPEM
jgi:predicted Zn-dependent peptidase